MEDSYLIFRQEKIDGIVRNPLYLTTGGWVVNRDFAMKFSLQQAHAVSDGFLLVAGKNPLNNLEFIIERK